MELGYLLAFTTGILSFLAPCVLPLLPAYISVMFGMSFSTIDNERTKPKISANYLLQISLFVFGFTLIFTLLGLSVSYIGQLLHINRSLFTQIGGGLIVLLGIFSLGILNIPNYFQRFKIQYNGQSIINKGFFGPLLLGMTFAFAWTPCVGAILGTIITLAATSGSVMYGTSLLITYSLGITVPFILISLSTSVATKYIFRFQHLLPTIQQLGGILLILTGILLITGGIESISKILFENIANTQWYTSLLDKL